MTIHLLNRSDSAAESVGWVASKVDEGAKGSLNVVLTSDGRIEAMAFGEVTVADMALIGAYLSKRAMQHVDGDL